MKTLLAIAAVLVGVSSYAQEESTTKAKKQEVTKGLTATPAATEDIDNEITNAKMRADSGSKSKHSVSASLGYSGGSLEDAFGKTRPRLSAGAATETKTSLAGDLSYRYRLTPSQSITAGFGVKWLTPGYELDKKDKDKGTSQYEASNPGLSYSASYKVGKIQNISSAAITKFTSAELTDDNYDSTYGIGHTAIMDIGTSGLQLGLAVDMSDYLYSKSADGQTQYEVGVYPFVEFAFNDTYNFRTVYRGNTYGSAREARWTFEQQEPTQSMGLGIAATRDIFLYPNVQWVWRDTRTEKTNVAVSASMNFF